MRSLKKQEKKTKIKVKRRACSVEWKDCPECNQWGSLKVITTYKLNYPYGRNSKPRYSPIKQFCICLDRKCKYQIVKILR